MGTTLSEQGRAWLAIVLTLGGIVGHGNETNDASGVFDCHSPSALVVSADSSLLLVACSGARQVVSIDAATGKVTGHLAQPEPPSGLALSSDGSRLYVTCAAPSSIVTIVDASLRRELGRVAVGHTAMSPVLSPDGKTLYVCNRFDNNISVVSIPDGREIRRIPVLREPVAAAITPDGGRLVVANHLHRGRADVPDVAAEVSVIDTASGSVTKNIRLPNGSGLLRGVAVSPDGRYAAVTHILARYYLPTIELDRGWMNNNALSLLDLRSLEWFCTVTLDDLDSGTANPWSVVWSSDGKMIVVAHAGTHELSLIDADRLLERLRQEIRAPDGAPSAKGSSQARGRLAFEIANDPVFMAGFRKRVPVSGKGPRSIALVGARIFVANYFSDTLSVIDLASGSLTPRVIEHGGTMERTPAERGEAFFNDATLCYQTWQSCASCHSSDGRTDGLNWDLLNDGIGNPKNTRSLVSSARTAPVMSQGVREDYKAAVRAGLSHILFKFTTEEMAQSIDAYLGGLAPVPSPHLVASRFSEQALRGRKLFMDPEVGCATCHPPEVFADQRPHDVGTRSSLDTVGAFQTPALVEVWRTAPYLHDGSAATIKELLTTRNAEDRHGRTSRLTREEIDDLVAFLLSL